LNPIFAITSSAFLLREPLSKRFGVLSVIALIAAYFLWLPHGTVNTATGKGTFIAGLMALGAAAAWGTSTAFSKYALKGTSTLHITALRFGITPFFALLFVVLSGSTHAIGKITLGQFGYLLAITFSTGMMALLIYYFGLKRVLASRAAILELAWPFSAVVVGYIWLHQGLTAIQGVAALVMIGAIYGIAQETSEPAQIERPKVKKPRQSRKSAVKPA
jgi:drug/metabolite transporter (DMT)-like permease